MNTAWSVAREEEVVSYGFRIFYYNYCIKRIIVHPIHGLDIMNTGKWNLQEIYQN